MNDLRIGQMVRSKAGRDKGNWLVVIGLAGASYVLVADGKTRKVESPKRKKIKHLAKTNTVFSDIVEKISQGEIPQNAFLRKCIEERTIKHQKELEV